MRYVDIRQLHRIAERILEKTSRRATFRSAGSQPALFVIVAEEFIRIHGANITRTFGRLEERCGLGARAPKDLA